MSLAWLARSDPHIGEIDADTRATIMEAEAAIVGAATDEDVIAAVMAVDACGDGRASFHARTAINQRVAGGRSARADAARSKRRMDVDTPPGGPGWITLEGGTHVLLGKGGQITKGPPATVGHPPKDIPPHAAPSSTAPGAASPRKVSTHLHATSEAAKAPLAHATKAIESVHEVGDVTIGAFGKTRVATFKPVEVRAADDPEREGAISISARGEVEHIEVSNSATTSKGAALVHEIGHAIDIHINGGNHFASANPDHPVVGPVMAAIDATPTMQQLQRSKDWAFTAHDQDYLGYLTQRHEVFARAYAQYIAHRSGDEDLRSTAAREAGEKHPTSWKEDEFKPVAEAFDRMIEGLGWKKN